MDLSEAEKAYLKDLLDRGEFLPAHYRTRLFAPREPELVWSGKGERDYPQPQSWVALEYFGNGEGGQLFQGDNLAVLVALARPPWQEILDQAGGLKLIYLDPPFNRGTDVWGDQMMGETTFSALAYTDTWDPSAYLTMMAARLRLMHGLLAPDGSIYVHCDWRSSAPLRLLLDEIFGREHFQNEICWSYRTQGASRRRFARKHDTLFFYTKSDHWTFNTQTERSYMQHRYGFANRDFKQDETGRQYRETLLRDVWETPALQSATRENLGYPTQKPEALLQRILECSSNPGDLVADFCCGSGTTLAVAQRLNRRWLGCDQSSWAIHTTRKRLSTLGANFTVYTCPATIPLTTHQVRLELGLSLGPDHTVQIHLQSLIITAQPPLFLGHWSNWVDYWAVDFSTHPNQPGRVNWSSFRTRHQRDLNLTTPPHYYPGPGTYHIQVWVVDLLAHRTTQELIIQL
ncbi:DNA methyltransferase [Candidatus Cyanaurora vandensis]|uniref:DNA methyltransferase n=1 Tax=Candidatus Cyanaurora vandensis TaxID=2714958 RepID=UPI00257E9CFA|nr:site-specific DNA-methyltransferase [Candidatus Cyanaurora vandensis]